MAPSEIGIGVGEQDVDDEVSAVFFAVVAGDLVDGVDGGDAVAAAYFAADRIRSEIEKTVIRRDLGEYLSRILAT